MCKMVFTDERICVNFHIKNLRQRISAKEIKNIIMYVHDSIMYVHDNILYVHDNYIVRTR